MLRKQDVEVALVSGRKRVNTSQGFMAVTPNLGPKATRMHKQADGGPAESLLLGVLRLAGPDIPNVRRFFPGSAVPIAPRPYMREIKRTHISAVVDPHR